MAIVTIACVSCAASIFNFPTPYVSLMNQITPLRQYWMYCMMSMHKWESWDSGIVFTRCWNMDITNENSEKLIITCLQPRVHTDQSVMTILCLLIK